MKTVLKNEWILLFALLFQSIAVCQENNIAKNEITPSGIYTANARVDNERISFNWTIGESMSSMLNSSIIIEPGALFPLRLDEIIITKDNIHLNRKELLEKITVYPNPFQYAIRLQNESKLINIESIGIYNTNGQHLKTIKMSERIFVFPYLINLIDIPKGSYLLEVKISTINNEELTKLFKLIKN